jgi:hypothetical protein
MSNQLYFRKLHNLFYFLNTLRTLLWAQWGTPTRRRKKKKRRLLMLTKIQQTKIAITKI